MDPSPDLQKVRRALLEEMGVGGDDITAHQLSGAEPGPSQVELMCFQEIQKWHF